jgi:hypothetical protein
LAVLFMRCLSKRVFQDPEERIPALVSGSMRDVTFLSGFY